MTEDKTPPAPLTWLENDTPVSARFDDSYFSRSDGREETREVFIQGNGLPDRWQNEKDFTIAELGFGTGLNFLETLRQWQKIGTDKQILKFVSFELYPIETGDIRKTLQRWQDLKQLGDDLCACWPPRPGENLWDFGTTRLRLFVGDARKLILQWEGKADAWYLDGFNPAKNPELWDPDLLQGVFERTQTGGSFSTYTSAGWVRRNLVAAGFDVKKVPGFGFKKERLMGWKS